jgi:hypothetical protein
VRDAIWLNSGLACWHYGPISWNSFRQFSSNSLFFECGGPRPKTPTFGFRRNRDSINFAWKTTVDLLLRRTFKAHRNRVAESPESDSSKFWFWFFFSFNGQNLELRKTQKILRKSVWSRGGQPELIYGPHLKKNEQNSKYRKITEFRRNFFLGRGLATPGLEAEKAIFRLKKSSKKKIHKKIFSILFRRRGKSLCCDHFAEKKDYNLTSSTLRREHKNRFSSFFFLFSALICSVDFFNYLIFPTFFFTQKWVYFSKKLKNIN